MNPYVDDQDFTLYVGDVREVLAGLPAESVHCCVTSPPYWGLRDYGTGSWDGGDDECDHVVTLGDGGSGVAAEGHASPFRNGKQYTHQQVSGNVCKCGARRIDHQLGLEPTLEEYVANMVAVFREVRRVLRRDGTCWLNIGDSYTSGDFTRQGKPRNVPQLPNDWEGTELGDRGRAGHARAIKRDLGALKPKDLVGIPWRLAFALQQPYYTGTIKDERDRIWLAAMVEAEGCMYLHRRKAGQSNGQGYERKNDSFGAGLEVASTDRVIAERCLAITGRGSISEQGPNENARRKQTIYRWNLRTNECREVISELYPHMIAKQHEARLLLGCPSSGTKATAAWQSLKDVHQGGEATIDFPPPETLFEPGWYVRSDIVWSKANPMPESVTDRPTKAHEYLFLLTRSPRYFYDADAIREPHSPDGRLKTVHDHGTPNSHENYDNVGNGNERWPNGGRNKRSVWEIATQPYPDAHFATFPQALVEPCVLAGTSERGCCPECGAQWKRETERERVGVSGDWRGHKDQAGVRHAERRGFKGSAHTNVETIDWRPTCQCLALLGISRLGVLDSDVPAPIPCTVLDPFMGSGTTALVARRHGRRSIGIELNGEYAKLAAARLQQLSLLAEPA